MLEPSNRPGWWWRPHRLAEALPISIDIVQAQPRQFVLTDGREKLGIAEHLIGLQYFGVTDITVTGRGLPPYDGCAELFRRRLLAKTVPVERREVEWHTVSREGYWEYPDLRGGKKAFTRVRPNDRPGLELTVTCAYPGLPEVTKTYVLPNKVLLEQICRARTGCWPPRGWQPFAWCNRWWWSHYNHIAWLRKLGPVGYMDEAADHRALDLLGCLASGCRNGSLLAAKVTSVCSGHLADVEAMKQIAKEICPF